MLFPALLFPALKPENKPRSITSLEISELVGSHYDSVRRTIERLVASGAIQKTQLVEAQDVIIRHLAKIVNLKALPPAIELTLTEIDISPS